MYFGLFFILMGLGAYLLLIFLFTFQQALQQEYIPEILSLPLNVVVQQISLLQLARHQTGAKLLGIPDYQVVPVLT